MHKICEPSFKNNYNPLLSSSCRHPLPWILPVVSNWIKWHASLRIEKKTGNFYLFFICFDAKMSFMFLLAYCHDLGCGTFVQSIMITTVPVISMYSIKNFYTIVKQCPVTCSWHQNLQNIPIQTLQIFVMIFWLDQKYGQSIRYHTTFPKS